MSYRVLTLAEIPLRDLAEALEQRRIVIMEATNPLRAAEENPGTLVEAKEPDGDGVLAAYMDLRPSKSYPRLRIGITVVLRTIRYESASLFAVDCRACGDQEQIGRCFHVFDHESARQLLISLVDYAGLWLDPLWFESNPSSSE